LTGPAKLKAGFGAGFAVLMGIGIAAVAQTLAWEQTSGRVAETHEVIERLDEVSLEALAAQESARSYVSAPDPRDLAEAREQLSMAKERAAELENMVGSDTQQRHNLQRVRFLVGQESAALLLGPDVTQEQVRRALDGLDGSGMNANLRSAILEMEAEARRILRERQELQARAAELSRLLFSVAAGFSLVLIIVAGWRMSTDSQRRGAAEERLAARDEQYRQVVELAGDVIYRTDRHGRLTFCNQAFITTLHYTSQELIGRSYLKLVRQDKRRETRRVYIRQYTQRQKNVYLELPLVDAHGRERWIGQNVQLLMEGERLIGYQSIAREITEQKRAEFELERSRNFVERIAATTPGILYVYDLDEQRTVYSNREVVQVLGFKPEEMQSAALVAGPAVHPDDLGLLNSHRDALRIAQDGEVLRVEFRARHADGHWVWLSTRETPFERVRNGPVKQVVGIAQDISARKAAQEKLTYQANYDALTGLPNRHHFWTRLQSALRRASIQQDTIAVCLFDVDRFKEINDRFGHAAGDEVLEAVGNIVRAELRTTGDIAGRLGGDEFCFALPGTDDNEAARVADRIRERLSTMAFGMEGAAPFSVTATFGVAESHPDEDARALLEAADRALYRAKSAGRNRVCVDA
jgi:diguanylate cyclase (GGDEF)-like protein/PAS domain S-box-containing protein